MLDINPISQLSLTGKSMCHYFPNSLANFQLYAWLSSLSLFKVMTWREPIVVVWADTRKSVCSQIGLYWDRLLTWAFELRCSNNASDQATFPGLSDASNNNTVDYSSRLSEVTMSSTLPLHFDPSMPLVGDPIESMLDTPMYFTWVSLKFQPEKFHQLIWWQDTFDNHLRPQQPTEQIWNDFSSPNFGIADENDYYTLWTWNLWTSNEAQRICRERRLISTSNPLFPCHNIP